MSEEMRQDIVMYWGRSMVTGTAVVAAGVNMDGSTGGVVNHFGVINRIERENGSGKCFNVTFVDGVTLFVRLA